MSARALIAASVQDGTQVLAVAGEFTSVIFPFAAQAHRGVTVTEVEPTELVSRVDGHDLIAVSVVQSADGAIADVDRLRDAAAASGARVLLDVTQAAGWLPLRLGWADWVVGASYKWLLSPRGAAWLALRPDALEWTVPHAANWYAAADLWSATYGLPLELAADARRLDLSPVWFAERGAAVALPWLAMLDIAAVYQHLRRTRRLAAREAQLAATWLGNRRAGSARGGGTPGSSGHHRHLASRPHAALLSPIQYRGRCGDGRCCPARQVMPRILMARISLTQPIDARRPMTSARRWPRPCGTKAHASPGNHRRDAGRRGRAPLARR
jgi:hypothetical protein